VSAAASYFLETPPPTGVTGALAMVRLSGDIDAACNALGLKSVNVGTVGLRRLERVDDALVMRWSEKDATVSVHAGAAAVEALLGALTEAGLRRLDAPSPAEAFPDAIDVFEALALHTLIRAASPAADNLLLGQPARWRDWDGASPSLDEIRDVSASLNHLVDPPIVAVVGCVNVGKSTLTNALARGTVSVVSQEAGATRDHVGVTLELPLPSADVSRGDDAANRLVVRWFDTPGLCDEPDADAPLADGAIALSRDMLARARMIVVCGDPQTGFPAPADLDRLGVRQAVARGVNLLRVATKSDLGAVPAPMDIAVSAQTNQGVSELASQIARALVPIRALAWRGPWLFDDRLLCHHSEHGCGPLADGANAT